MRASQRRRVDRLTGVIAPCARCADRGDHLADIAAARIHANLQRALAEHTPPALRRKAAEAIAEAKRLEREEASDERLDDPDRGWATLDPCPAN